MIKNIIIGLLVLVGGTTAGLHYLGPNKNDQGVTLSGSSRDTSLNYVKDVDVSELSRSGIATNAKADNNHAANSANSPGENQSSVKANSVEIALASSGAPDTYNGNARLDKGLASNGKKAAFNPAQYQGMESGEGFTLDLNGNQYEATVRQNEKTKLGRQYLVADMTGTTSGSMTVYYGKKKMRGKIYTEKGAFIYESNGKTTYIMPLYKYKEMNNALAID